ncbi:aminotransferase class V-fold PLP-dependent enzyme [Methylibium rhizosphaerae]|uniref:aminotransferase class V-fold PLP-dependent enzyme n=1 Tax=Methylibium rhizosphaerae TaxID=2570323 RepID=UPI0011293945|nr:aminotransferase class V-fold PLP-dependent enzyme [Methylibium rhizosphaerae]
MQDLDFRLPAFESALAELPPSPGAAVAHDEHYWDLVRRLYDVAREPANLEQGYWGVMAEPVKAMFHHWTDRVNRENTLLVRDRWPALQEGVRQQVAQALGCATEEVALTRGASEAMFALIGGFNRLAPGDTVLYCDLDYPATRNAMAWLRERRGVVPVQITMPEPASREGVIAAYAQALAQHPRTRLVLLTHLSHSTGLVMPVRELSALAHEAGAQVIVDAAHSWGQLDFDAPDLGAPYAGFNLHKWAGAPLGNGCLYVKRGAVAGIDRWFGDRDWGEDDVRSRMHTGSPSFAAWLTLPAALQLHRHIGAATKEARLRALRHHWVQRARTLPGVQVLTPDDALSCGGITSFRLAGRTSETDNEALVRRLRDEHGVLTVRREGPAAGQCVRVTPALHTTLAELDRLVDGLRAITAAG